MITGVTVTYKGKTHKLPKPLRHHHVSLIAYIFGEVELGEEYLSSGFYTDTGEFLNREEAGKHALECKQVDKLNWPPDLYSEDLW